MNLQLEREKKHSLDSEASVYEIYRLMEAWNMNKIISLGSGETSFMRQTGNNYVAGAIISMGRH